MKEKPSHTSLIHHAAEMVRVYVPDELLNKMNYMGIKVSIFEALDRAAREVPELEQVAATTMKYELGLFMKENGRSLSQNSRDALDGSTQSLPEYPREIQSESFIDPFSLSLFDHDIGLRFIAYIDTVHFHNRDSIHAFDLLFRDIAVASFFQYRYTQYLHTSQEMIAKSYAKLFKLYVEHAVIPSIQELLQNNLPFETFQLHELRSAYRELAGIDPTTWAVEFPLRSVLESYIKNQKFVDKNTNKPVSVVIDENSTDPMVYMDPGDLYRMTRNLLRDAVTHGDGDVITPIIQIQTTDNIVELSIYSPGHLEPETLAIISHQPYTTQDSGDRKHGYGKVGARKLLTSLWASLGLTSGQIESLLKGHWSNITVDNSSFVRWLAPIPIASKYCQ